MDATPHRDERSGGPAVGRRERVRQALAFFRTRYLAADLRTLGFARLIVGTLMCVHALDHLRVARLYYSNEGVLPNHFLLFRPSSDFNFSFFSAFATPNEVTVAFAGALVCHLCFAVGFHARIFSALSLLWVTSLDNRLVLVENGGYVVVNLLALWLAFLPTGKRFGVDALRARLRSRHGSTVEALCARTLPPSLTAPHFSLASFLVVANLGVVYVFNVVNKYGSRWRDGSTVHSVLHLDRMVTGLAVLLRESLPYPLLQLSSWLTLIVEALLAVLIFWPSQRRVARPLAMALMLTLHGTFGVVMRLGPFSWFMIGWSTLLMQRAHWDALSTWHSRRFGGVTLTLRSGSPLALRLGRLVDALAPVDALAFAVGEVDGPIAEVLSHGRPVHGRAALRTVVRALPLGWLAWPGLELLSLGQAHRLVAFAGSRAEKLERFFGWDRPEGPRRTSDAFASGWVNSKVATLREGVLAFLALCALSGLVKDNKSVATALKHEQPKVIRATVGYLRIFQGWGMFAPNPVRDDGIGVVEAWTRDGRRLDPFTTAPPEFNLSEAKGLGLEQIEQDYWNRIRLDRFKVYHQPLADFLKSWHRFTGSPSDELVAFDVWWLRDRSPEPGRIEPSAQEKVCLLSWRKPRHRQPREFPAIPARCTPTSADSKD